MQTRLCVRCGKHPANRVEVELRLFNVAEVDQPTSVILGDDACESCQADVIGVIQKHAVEKMREQAPIHRDIVHLMHAIDDATAAAIAHRPVLEANAMLAQPDPAVVQEHEALLDVVLKKEEERLAKVRAGTAVSDTRDALMLAELRAPGA